MIRKIAADRTELKGIGMLLDFIRGNIDEIFREKILERQGAVAHVANCTNGDWNEAQKEYSDAVVKGIHAAVNSLKGNKENWELLTPMQQEALSSCAAKVFLILNATSAQMRWWTFPLPCVSMLKVLADHLEKIAPAIAEVCINIARLYKTKRLKLMLLFKFSAWFSPFAALIGSSKVHPPPWNQGSESADMIRALYGYSRFETQKHGLVVDIVSNVIWVFFSTEYSQ